MAKHKSAKKRARQAIKRNVRNRARRSKIRTLAKSLETAIAKNDAKAIETSLRTAESALARASRRGTMHWKTAARKTSRLARKARKAIAK